MNKSYFSRDILEFLNLLFKFKVKYLIVGGEAVIFYGHARLTGDIDIFYERSSDNLNNLYAALNEFWKKDIPGIKSKEELAEAGMVFQFGIPPNRIDLINIIEKINFSDAWKNKLSHQIEYKKEIITIYYIGLDDLITNKEAIKRNKDQDDLQFLKEAKKRKPHQ
jgi:hypothetical protein